MVERERTLRVGGKAKEHYWTISPPRSIVGGLPKPEYTMRVSGTGSRTETKVRGRWCVCVGVCVAVFSIHTPSGCCSEMRRYVRCLQASIRPFLLFRADYSTKLYSSEYFLMSIAIQQRKFVSFLFVWIWLAGGKEHIRWSDLISVLVCEEQAKHM